MATTYTSSPDTTPVPQLEMVSRPVISHASGTYDFDQSITLNCEISDATIYYTTDGYDPDAGSLEYTTPIPVAGQGTIMTIKAIALKDGMLDSEILSETYNIDYYLDWSDSVNITISAHTIGLSGDVAQFPLLIRLNTSNFPDIATKTMPGGSDIRFTKTDGTELYYEIEDWVDNTSATVWILVDNISSSSQTVIKMHYNNPPAADNSQPNKVFDVLNGFSAVYHMNQDPSGGADSIIDSTGNLNHGTPQNGMGAADLIAANVGKGLNFDSSASEYIAAHYIPDINGGSFSFSAWLKRDTTGSCLIIAGQGNSFNDNGSLHIGYRDTDRFTFAFWNNDIDTVEAYTNTTNFEYWSGTYNITDNSMILYKDGNNKNTYTTTNHLNTPYDPFEIGRSSMGGGGNYWDGIIDEFRIESVVRSADWIKLSYETQNSAQTIVNIP